MNTNLVTIVKKIVADYGENILANPQRLKSFFSDLAKDEPKKDYGNAIADCTQSVRINPENLNCGYFLKHHLVNNLGGTFTVCHSFGQEIICRAFCQPQLPQFPLGKPVTAFWSKLRNGSGQFLVKCIIFFISHVGIVHRCAYTMLKSRRRKNNIRLHTLILSQKRQGYKVL
ncbi:MAG: hypothetical protein Ta2A_11330 [Treponemataceae bacterium]|nr:MAG: hypothetical protein Ta2A_11330 [Treponemataceae bacterium]